MCSTVRKISILRKLKFMLSRDALITCYTTFIRPVFEYCCELWNGCGAELTERLEHLQLAIARIVTGLPA